MRKLIASVPSLFLCLVFLAAVSFDAAAAPCVVPDNGSGTVTLPPAGCGYLSPTDVHEIIAGLPAGTTIELTGIHRDFVCNRGSQGTPPGVCDFVPSPACDEPGGALGGAHECADSVITMNLQGTGTLGGWSRTIQVPLAFETEVGPRTPGQPLQQFPTRMLRMQGQLPPGDPDFDLLRITAGDGFGLPSPGQTTLQRLGGAGAPFQVDSFFDITYRIDFVGHPGGRVGGMSGSTTATIRMTAGAIGCQPLNCDDGNPCTIDTCNQVTQTCDHVQNTCDDGQVCTDDFCNPATGECTHSPTNCDDGNPCTIDSCVQALLTPPCTVPDNGSGTVTLPPAGCDYLSPTDVHEIIDGLPAGTTIQLGAIHKDFICRTNQPSNPVCSFPPNGVDCDEPGGSLAGDKECSESNLQMELHGTGALAGWIRTIVLPIGFETHTGPRVPGQPVQSFDTDMFRLFGQITNPGSGDPDFDLLRIVAGTDFGMPSPGHTTLTQQGANWAVDSFFDITYRIDFVGRPGGHLSGMSGSTTGTIRMQTGAGVGCVHTPVTCADDGNPCTDEVCDPGTGGCVIVNDDTNTCTDGNACTNDACVGGVCTCPTTVGACTGNSKHFDSTDVPKVIPTTAPPNVVTSTLTVVTPDTFLYDINVRTFIKHTSSGQIQMTLTSPSGRIVTLTTQNGGTLDDVFNGTIWDDDADPGNQVPFTANTFAASNMVTDTLYANLTVKARLVPEEALGAFIGDDPNGVWTLTIADTTNLDGGSLDAWSVDIVTLPDPPAAVVNVYPSADVPKAILDTPTVSSVLTVSGAGTQIGRVRLNASITHTWNGDSDITLTSPGGTIVTITTDNGSSSDNAWNGTLWDAQADPGNQVPYTVPSAASFMVTDTAYVNLVVETTLTSEESLAAFVGEDPNGTWTLRIDDDGGGDTGTLSAWSLEILTTLCSVTDCDVECNDNNPCTDDSCDPFIGCVYTPNSNACSDGLLCTTGDICFNGACLGNPTQCDDGNVCTDDTCNPNTGKCLYASNTAPCDDGNACTVGDACSGVAATQLSENFDGVVAPVLPTGWTETHSPVSATPWVTTIAFASSAPNSANADTPTLVSDKTLDTPPIVVGGGGVVTFDNRYNLEFSTGTPGLGFDGAVLEIKIGANAFADIVTAGGSFNTGGYTHTISPSFTSPIAGRPAWSGASTGFVATSVTLPPNAANQTIQLRFRVASDSSAAATAPNGQWIDNVVVTSDVPTCKPGGPANCDDNNACTDDSCVQALLPPACIVNDNGGGTVSLPPAGCEYLSPNDVHEIINGLPPGTTIEFAPIHRDFICHSPDGQPGNCSFVPPPGLCEQPGGALGGDQECAQSNLALALHGTGVLAGWDRTLVMPLQFETAVGPRTPGAPVQSFPTEMRRMFGQLPAGDPDFDLLRITGGTDFGMPSPGHTTLRTQGNGTWSVDSFFDITYRIDFVGKPGGPVGGMSGSTTGTIRMATGSGVGCVHTPTDCNDNDPCTTDGCDPVGGCYHTPVSCDDGQVCTTDACDSTTGQCTHTQVSCDDQNACTADSCIQALVTPACTVPDNGGGTVTLPPVGCDYLSPQDVHEIVDGLPAGTTIEFAANHRDFICGGAGVQTVCSFAPPPGFCDQPGGSLGGQKECAESTLTLNLHGTGTLAGWDRVINLPISFETHVGPRTPGAPMQSFPTDMFRLFGQITNPGSGDPDFDLLRVVAGTDFGLPSPGHTTLTRQGPPGSNWAVDSFFDITYRIDFVGRPGGHIGGMSGSTTATIRMQTGAGVGCIHTNIVCNDGNVCTDDACDPASGCFTTNNTAACDDANPCTSGDVCAGGNCSGVAVPPPGEALNVQAPDKTNFTWNATPGATRYDVLRGAIGLLPVGPGGGDETCFNDLPGPTVNDPAPVPAGGALFYLSRGQSACGTGTYGNRSNGTPRTSTTCP